MLTFLFVVDDIYMNIGCSLGFSHNSHEIESHTRTILYAKEYRGKKETKERRQAHFTTH